MALTVKELEAIGQNDAGRTLFDGDSLYGKVHVGKTGIVRVAFTFRFYVGGKAREKSVGSWPKKTLAQIRKDRNKLQEDVANGIDPVEQRAKEIHIETKEITRKANTPANWDAAFTEWDESIASTFDEHYRSVLQSQWKCHLSPHIGQLGMIEASRQPLNKHYNAKVKEGKEHTARKALSLMIRLTNWAIDKEYLPETHPLTALKLPAKKAKVSESQKPENFNIQDFLAAHGREAIGNDHEMDAAGRSLKFPELVKLLHEQLPASSQSEAGKCAIRLMLATGIRSSEIVRLRWNWISMEEKLLIMPSGSMKKKRMHHVHLSDFALAQLKKMQETRTGAFVFQAPKKEDDHIRRDNVGADIALRQFYEISGETAQDRQERFDNRMAQRRAKKDFNLYNMPGGSWTLYDMRRTAATRLAELGFEREAVSAVLAHAKPDDSTTGRYELFSRWERRCEALDALGDALQSCEAGTLPALLPRTPSHR